jgi:small redox-active disulfide protein 2
MADRPHAPPQLTTRLHMKKLIILGSGCTKCANLSDMASKACEEIGLDYEIEKITDLLRFADFGVMMTPALVVDGEVVVSGRVPPVEEMKALLGDQ